MTTGSVGNKEDEWIGDKFDDGGSCSLPIPLHEPGTILFFIIRLAGVEGVSN